MLKYVPLSRTTALAVLCAAAALAAPPGSEAMRALAVLSALVAVALGPRLVAERFVETAASGVALVVGLLVARLTAADAPIAGALGDRAVLLGLPMLFLAAMRSMMKAPAFGAKATLAAALVALVASGRVNRGYVFIGMSVLFVAYALMALRAEDPSRATAKDLTPRHRAVVVSAFAIGLGITVTLGLTLPPLYAGMLDRLSARWLQGRVGFSESMNLGSLEGLYQSDRVVLRVRGEIPTHVRGMVWDEYNGRRWDARGGREPREIVETPTSYDGAETEVEYAGTPQRYFVPLGADHVASSGGVMDRDVYGTLSANEIIASKRMWFDAGEVAPSRGPNEFDLGVPRYLSPSLDDLLRRWGVTRELPPAERIEIIRTRLLADYTYSLEFQRDPADEPIIDFLTNEKSGHCEYFASAFVLLARRAEVPARLIGGYRVEERSPFGYAIVRDLHAHAWAEVWLEDRWRTEDPTPASMSGSVSNAETGLFAALVDGARTGWEVVDDWLGRRSAFEFAMALVVLGFGWLGLRSLRGRTKKVARKGVEFVAPELPLLLAELAKKGIVITPADTLSLIRARLESSDVIVNARDITEVLADYEAHVYGGIGEASSIRLRLAEVTRGLAPA